MALSLFNKFSSKKSPVRRGANHDHGQAGGLSDVLADNYLNNPKGSFPEESHINDMFPNMHRTMEEHNCRISLHLRVDTTHVETLPRLKALLEFWIDEFEGSHLDYTLLTVLYSYAVANLRQETPKKWILLKDMIVSFNVESTISSHGTIHFRWNRSTGMGINKASVEFSAQISRSKRLGRPFVAEACRTPDTCPDFLDYMNRLGVILTKQSWMMPTGKF